MTSAAPTEQATPTTPPREDLAWLSWLRVVCIVSVVAMHTLYRNTIVPDARDTVRGDLAIYLAHGTKFAVLVFVMMSGATLLSPRSYRGPGPFLRKRAVRLVPPLVFWHVWYLLLVLHDRPDLGVREVVAMILNGNLYTALYFFWIVLGLALFTPVLVPFVASVSRRAVLVLGVGLALMPALSVATRQVRNDPVVIITTPWTWWLPYVGLFVLGYALRGVVLRGPALLAAVAGVVAGFWYMGWQFQNPDVPAWLTTYVPATYYSGLTILYSVLVYLVAQGIVREGAALGFLARGRLARWGRTLGDATLGVFGLHLTLLYVVERHLFAADGPAAAGTVHLFVRGLVVLVATYAIVLVLRKVPLVQRVL